MPKRIDPEDLLSDEEVVFIEELVAQDIPFLIIGTSAATLQGADVVTQDIDLWIGSLTHPGIDIAARKAGGIFAWRAYPPMISGPNLDHIDVVTRPNGLRGFDAEYDEAVESDIFGIPVKVLPLDRVIKSKEAAGRPKDKAVLPALYAALAAIDDD